MKRKGAASLFMALCLGSVAALLLILVIILANQRMFDRQGDLIGTFTIVLGVIAVGSAILWLLLLASEKRSKYHDVLNGQPSIHVCPTCRINVAADCQWCPNCKTLIQRR